MTKCAYQKTGISVGRILENQNTRIYNVFPDNLIHWYSTNWYADVLINYKLSVYPLEICANLNVHPKDAKFLL